MENELVVNNEPNVLACFTEPVVEEEIKDLNSLSSSNYIPSLCIAYGVSDSVKKKRIATPGDFVLGGMTNLKDTIEISVLDWRKHAVVYDGVAKNLVSGKDAYEFRNGAGKEAYKAFITQTGLPSSHEVQEGVDVFAWLPKHQVFVNFFMKKTVAKFATQLVVAGKSPKVARVSTVYRDSPRNPNLSWYDLAISETSERVEQSDIPLDMAQKYYKLFTDPTKGVETVAEGAPEGRLR